MTTSMSFGDLPQAPTAELIQELRSYEVAWISDAMGGLYLVDPGVRPVYPGVPRVVGPAVTVLVPPGDFLMISAALKQTRPGDVLVVDGRGATHRALWGEYFSNWAKGLGVAAMLIDGAARDASGIAEAGFPVFARGTISRGPTLNGNGEINGPVSCGGVCVLPGDIVVADQDGAVVIPLRHLDKALKRIRATAERERSHNGVPAGGRAEYDAYFKMGFEKRIAAAPPVDVAD